MTSRNKQQRLGSGIDALFGTRDSQPLRELELDRIHQNRSQPRTHFDEQALEELAASIKLHGLIQPVIVTEDPAGGYELIAGERRWRAARRAGLNRIPALIKQATPVQLLELALVENVQRADLNPLEEGRAYQTLKDEFGLTDDEIARRVAKSRVAVVNARRLIRLAPPVQQALLDGAISAGHGRALLRLEQAEHQVAALALLVERDLSVREAERLADLAQDARLAQSVQQALLAGRLAPAQALDLLRIDDPEQQVAAARIVLAENLAAREVEQLCTLVAEGLSPARAFERVRTPAQPAAPPTPPVSSARQPLGSEERMAYISPQDEEARRMFEELLATPVHISRSGNAIKLTITLFGDEQLQSLYNLLSQEA